MGEPTRRPVSYQDILDLPEHKVGEIVDGELYVSPRPAPRHSLAASALTGELVGPFIAGPRSPGGWLILVEPELHLGPDVMVPDLAGWRRERMPGLPEGAQFTVAPDWTCEVLSPSTARVDLAKKLPKYAAAGVAHVRLIDPMLRALQVFRCEGKRWALLETRTDGDRARVEALLRTRAGARAALGLK